MKFTSSIMVRKTAVTFTISVMVDAFGPHQSPSLGKLLVFLE